MWDSVYGSVFLPCPCNFSRRIRKVSWDRRPRILFLEELCDPLHLVAERVDHPDVLLSQDSDRHHLAQTLKSGEVLERVGGVPHAVVGGFQFAL